MGKSKEDKKDRIALAQFQKKEATIILQDQKVIAQLIKQIAVDTIAVDSYVATINRQLSFMKNNLEDENG